MGGAIVVVLALAAGTQAASRPHIIWVVADDLGYNDVPFTGTGSEVQTPHLAALAADGLVLGKYYVNAICTPTRASFMTGRYPIHLGLQHGVIRDGVPDAVPINETLIANIMQQAGYATHMIGKWHLGFHQPRFTPERRGFDAVFGYYTGNEEYWNHTSPCWNCGNFTALDFHRANASHFEPIVHMSGVYSTNIFADEAVRIISEHASAKDPRPLFMYLPFEAVHGASSCYREGAPPDCSRPNSDELQAPEFYIEKQKAAGISDERRATFGAMVGALDDAVANISAALQATGLAENALLLFTTDNGAPDNNFDHHAMSNYPLRGGKGTNWEGGVRGVGLLYSWSSAILPKPLRGARSTELMHCSDWFPTFAGLAGAKLTPAQQKALDGYDMWPTVRGEMPSPRHEIMHNIDPTTGQLALRVDNYKYLLISQSSWGPDPRNFSGLPAGECLHEDICPKRQGSYSVGSAAEGLAEYFFKIDVDPQERKNLLDSKLSPADQKALDHVKSRLESYQRSMVPLRNPDPDMAAQPEVVPGLNICTPSPLGPILCQDVGIWRPWQLDPEGAAAMKQSIVV